MLKRIVMILCLGLMTVAAVSGNVGCEPKDGRAPDAART
jgi:hypothetical protein